MLLKLVACLSLTVALSSASVISLDETSAVAGQEKGVKSVPISFVAYEHASGVTPNPSIKFTSKIPNLSTYNWNDKIRRSCSTGQWLVYDDFNYEWGAYWMAGSNNCMDYANQGFPAGKVSSLRYAGASQDYSVPCISLYEKVYMAGQEFATCSDAPSLGNLNAKSNSLIVTTKSIWTLYSEENYGGSKICFDYTNWGFHAQLGEFANTFKSVRKGCFAETYAEPAPINIIHEDENGAYGTFLPPTKIV